MKNSKGFIQISILIVIVAGVLILGGAGYLGVKQYYKERGVSNETSTEAQSQQKSLELAREEIEQLKRESASTAEKQRQLEQQVKQTHDSVLGIFASEIRPLQRGVVQIDCGNVSGTGSLWKINNSYSVLTNRHVINGGSFYNKDYCFAQSLIFDYCYR